LELIVAQSISRAKVFAGSLLAMILSVVLILTIIWSGFALDAHLNEFDLSPVELARPFISLFAILMVILSLAFLLSMILHSSNSASMISGFLLIASYFISSLVNLDEKFEGINRFSP
jgi:ABC-type transport system involved in multi-copper enzyme maturation permease subunit